MRILTLLLFLPAALPLKSQVYHEEGLDLGGMNKILPEKVVELFCAIKSAGITGSYPSAQLLSGGFYGILEYSRGAFKILSLSRIE